MYLLQYSIDTDYLWNDDCCSDYGVDPQPGEKEIIVGGNKDELVEHLNKALIVYGDADSIYKNEMLNLKGEDYKVNEPYLTVHGCWEIKDTIAFELKDTIEFKEFVKKETKRLQEQEEYDIKRQEDKLRERELKELRRLKEKYEE